MKNFSTIITESAILVPEFIHPDLVTPRDSNGRFWKTIENANEMSGKTSKVAYARAQKLAKELYSTLITIEDENVAKVCDCVNDVAKALDKAAAGALEDISQSDLKLMRNYLFIIQKIDAAMSNKSWFKSARVDVKAGYAPYKGASKDPKIKYRMVYNLENAVAQSTAKEINRTIKNLSLLHADYVASVEWNSSLTSFAVMLSNSPGYKR